MKAAYEESMQLDYPQVAVKKQNNSSSFMAPSRINYNKLNSKAVYYNNAVDINPKTSFIQDAMTISRNKKAVYSSFMTQNSTKKLAPYRPSIKKEIQNIYYQIDKSFKNTVDT